MFMMKKGKEQMCFLQNNPKKDLKYFYANEDFNTTTDYLIFRFLVRLKLTLNRI
jgi:hypothetical protein